MLSVLSNVMIFVISRCILTLLFRQGEHQSRDIQAGLFFWANEQSITGLGGIWYKPGPLSLKL